VCTLPFAILPLLESLLCQVNVTVGCSLRLLDETVKQQHLVAGYREQGPRDSVTEGGADFPNSAAQVIDPRLADRPFELNVGNVFADRLSLVLRQRLQPLSYGLVRTPCPKEDGVEPLGRWHLP
jgi:hypothetical protein